MTIIKIAICYYIHIQSVYIPIHTNTYIRTYIHPYIIHTFIHTYLHIYIHEMVFNYRLVYPF